MKYALGCLHCRAEHLAVLILGCVLDVCKDDARNLHDVHYDAVGEEA